MQHIGSKSKHVAAKRFPDLVREHAAAAGMPCDRLMEIQTVGPRDVD